MQYFKFYQLIKKYKNVILYEEKESGKVLNNFKRKIINILILYQEKESGKVLNNWKRKFINMQKIISKF